MFTNGCWKTGWEKWHSSIVSLKLAWYMAASLTVFKCSDHEVELNLICMHTLLYSCWTMRRGFSWFALALCFLTVPNLLEWLHREWICKFRPLWRSLLFLSLTCLAFIKFVAVFEVHRKVSRAGQVSQTTFGPTYQVLVMQHFFGGKLRHLQAHNIDNRTESNVY